MQRQPIRMRGWRVFKKILDQVVILSSLQMLTDNVYYMKKHTKRCRVKIEGFQDILKHRFH